ncbi:MAG: hypothetical protein ACE15C_01965 [Phycisphaerae bacterium]
MAGTETPLAFRPPRVYVLRDVWDDPLSARRARRLCEACPQAEVRTFTYSDLPDIVVQEGWDHPRRMGSLDRVPPPIPVLGLFRFDAQAVAEDQRRMRQAYKGDGEFPFRIAAGGDAFVFFCSTLSQVRPDPQHICRPQWRIHQGRGCPHQCAYCKLGGFILANVNTEVYIEHLAELLRQNPWQKTWLYDDVMDVPTMEPYIDTLGPLMRFFQSTGDRYLVVHTKSDRVEPFLEAGAPSNTIVVWSLAGPTQAGRLERVAGTTEGRVEAARRCQEAGLTVRYKFKPIVPVRDWRSEAAYTIDLALGRTRPDNLSMTVLMWMEVEDLKGCIPSELLDPQFLYAAQESKDAMHGSRNAPFPHELRLSVYRHYLSEIRRRDPDVPVTVSTESAEMWASMSKDLGVTIADYVCGCGAGATPNKRRLDSNPWRDALDARTWDGRAIVSDGNITAE